jgi:hypothetical protein
MSHSLTFVHPGEMHEMVNEFIRTAQGQVNVEQPPPKGPADSDVEAPGDDGEVCKCSVMIYRYGC